RRALTAVETSVPWRWEKPSGHIPLGDEFALPAAPPKPGANARRKTLRSLPYKSGRSPSQRSSQSTAPRPCPTVTLEARRSPAMYDLVIRNGTVIDGTGAPRFQADVAVKDGTIVEIGKVKEGARKVIDAAGCIVAPGFIDP